MTGLENSQKSSDYELGQFPGILNRSTYEFSNPGLKRIAFFSAAVSFLASWRSSFFFFSLASWSSSPLMSSLTWSSSFSVFKFAFFERFILDY
jgi:hypothetical protein